MSIKPSLLIILCFGMLAPLSAVDLRDAINVRFKTYTVDDGLLMSSVSTIFQDSRGLIWLGTQDGLNLFDGREFEKIGTNPNYSIGYIFDINEDPDGNILIGASSGLYLYDIALDILVPFHEQLKDYDVLKFYSVTKDELIVALRGHGLYRFYQGELLPLIKNTDIFDFTVRGQLVYAATAQGLIIYNFQDQLTERVIRPDLKILSLLLRDDTLCAGIKDGILEINLRSGELKLKSLSSPVTAMIAGADGALWIGTASKGLFLENSDSEGAIDFGEPGTVLSMFLDRSDNLWIGYLGIGLKKIDIHRVGFSYLGPEGGLDNPIVVSLWEDLDGSLWVGTFGGGLYHFSTERVLIEHLAYDPNTAGSPGDNRIISLFRDSRGVLWMGTKSSGIYTYQNGVFTHVKGSYSSVYAIDEDKYGRLWAVTQGEGVHIFRADGSLEKTLKAPILPTLSYRTLLIHDDKVYLGSMDNGLIVLDLEGNLLRHYSGEIESEGLQSSHILSIVFTEKGSLWVGTFGGGLHRYDPLTDRFDSLTTQDGLPNNTVYGVLEDQKNRLWISTNKGLALISPDTLEVTTFSQADGLQGNEFNSGAALKGKDTFYMGGVNGLTLFNPDKISMNSTPPETLLTELSINNKKVHVGESVHQRILLPKAIHLMDEIVLTRDELVVTLDFRALHYSAPQSNQYAYYLEGLESDWNYTGTSLHSTYTNLSPGSYRFWYKSASPYGVWSPEKSIGVIVQPKFYEYLIFKIGMALILMSLVLMTAIILIQKGEKKKLILEERVMERTRELEEAFLREKKMRGILSIGEKMSSLVSLTVRLSHNLNTPLGSSLTALSYLKDSLEKTGADQRMIDCCDMALEGTNQAVNIVKQLSSASNARALPSPVIFNLNDIIREYMSQSWFSVLEKNHIQCTLDLPETGRYILGSISALQESLDSLIRNSLHHGFVGSEEPLLDKVVSLKVVYSEREALVIYRDNGKGIDEGVQTKIFEPFEGGTGPGSGSSGIGLFLVYNLIKLQFSGSISCVNDHKGACFHIRLPLLDEKKGRI